MFRNNKPLLFASLGFVSGAIGNLPGEFLPRRATAIVLIAKVAIWAALLGGAIAAGLFAASEIYHRRRGYFTSQILRYVKGGLIGGAIAGATAQLVFGAGVGASALEMEILRALCWGLMGGILGWQLAAAIPNLQKTRGAIAGVIGGTLGGVGFILISAFFPDYLGRMAGVGALGAALGLAMVIADSLFREAVLEIVWAPKEITKVALGAKTVTIGGGEDDIYVYGLSPRTAGVVIDQGKIQYVELGSGRRTDLRDGSRIKIGSIEIIVHAYR